MTGNASFWLYWSLDLLLPVRTQFLSILVFSSRECMNESMCVLYMNKSVVCVFVEAISPFPFGNIFCIEETSEAHGCPLHPPTQRIPICSPAWEALDFLPLPPHTFFPGRFETGSVFVVFGWRGDSRGNVCGCGDWSQMKWQKFVERDFIYITSCVDIQNVSSWSEPAHRDIHC